MRTKLGIALILFAVLIACIPTRGVHASHVAFGTDWYQQSKVLSEGSINDATFTDANTGWAVANNGLYVTRNGGLTWSYVIQFANNDLRKIMFTDTQHGYIIGDSLFTTQDGGATWQRNTSSSLPSGLTAIAVPTTSNIFLGTDAGLWVSTDGGASWDQVTFPDNGDGTPVESIVFTSQSEGWLLIDDELYHTTDGGQIWTDTNVSGKAQAWPSASNGFVVEISSNYGDTSSSARYTTDGGATFSNSSSFPQDVGSVNSIVFSSLSQGVLGSDQAIFVTSDGGNTWANQTITSGDFSQIAAVGFRAGTPYAITNNGLFLHYGKLPVIVPPTSTPPPTAVPTNTPAPTNTAVPTVVPARAPVKVATSPALYVSVQHPSIKRGSMESVLVKSQRTLSITFTIVASNNKAIPGVKATSQRIGRGVWRVTIRTDARKTPIGTERLQVAGINGKQSTTSFVSYRVTK